MGGGVAAGGFGLLVWAVFGFEGFDFAHGGGVAFNQFADVERGVEYGAGRLAGGTRHLGTSHGRFADVAACVAAVDGHKKFPEFFWMLWRTVWAILGGFSVAGAAPI